MQRNRVDLPEPDLPRRATISPSCNRRLTSSSTGSGWPAGVVKLLLTWFTSKITSPAGSGPGSEPEPEPEPGSVLGCWSVICPPGQGHSEYLVSARWYSGRHNSRFTTTT